MMDVAEASLTEIAAAIAAAAERPTQSQLRLLERLRHHATRLEDMAFQLAVLGQFKRGKSTLLNAFVGYPLLSTGVLPLTAVPTFLFGAPTMQLRLCQLAGGFEEQRTQSFEELAAMIAAATTEQHNPHNQQGLRRVEVGVPSNRWLDDVTLIDTPGIGSTHTHNTDTAHAVLPECDAALFVLSVDPPITEVEVQYLGAVCRTVARIIVVLNKVDLVDRDDQEKALAFLSSILSRRPEAQIDRKIFPVSARQALDARRAGEAAALRASGLPALEDYVRSSLVDQKRGYLEISIAKKVSDILDALRADAALTARALAVPLGDLDEKIDIFETAAAAFAQQRDHLEDLLSGEWRRALGKLNALCEQAQNRADHQLETTLADVNRSADWESAQSGVEAVMSMVFDREFNAIAATVDADLAAAVEAHQQQFEELAARVHETAGALMDVRLPPAAPHDWFQMKREPYWIGQARAESLGSLTADWLTKLLPSGYQRRRRQKQLCEAVRRAVTRNISDLHWTMQQNIDDSFRRLLGSAREAVDASIASTREVLAVARERRRSEDNSLQHDIQQAHATMNCFEELRKQLDRHLQRA